MAMTADAASRRSRARSRRCCWPSGPRTSGCARSSRSCSAIASAAGPRRLPEDQLLLGAGGGRAGRGGRRGRERSRPTPAERQAPRGQAPDEPRRAAGASAADRDGRRHRGPRLPLLPQRACTGSARTSPSGSTSCRRSSACWWCAGPNMPAAPARTWWCRRRRRRG